MEGGGVETAQCPGVGTVQQEQKEISGERGRAQITEVLFKKLKVGKPCRVLSKGSDK